jgi:eukaryotic-like serine/threonine-protein kinase
MYALLARRPVFRGKSLPEVLHKQRFEAPEPLRKHAPDVPEELERIIEQLLAKDPDQRIPNANVLGRRLETFLQGLNAGPETMEAGTGWFQPGQSAVAMQPTKPVVTSPAEDVPATQVLAERNVPQSLRQADSLLDGPTAVTPPETVARPSHFVPVGADELDRVEEERTRQASWWHTGALVVALGLIGVGAWWLLQPPSADSLYNRIPAKTPDEPITSKSEADQAEATILEFLDRFPNDPRASELRACEKKIQLYLLEWTLANRSEGLLPIERVCQEAVNAGRSNPELGVAKLHALLALYETSKDDAGPTGLCLTLARGRLAQFQKQVDERAKPQLELIQERLKAADELREEKPERARTMYRAIIDLYGDKPWAANAVGHAREALEEKVEPGDAKP